VGALLGGAACVFSGVAVAEGEGEGEGDEEEEGGGVEPSLLSGAGAAPVGGCASSKAAVKAMGSMNTSSVGGKSIRNVTPMREAPSRWRRSFLLATVEVAAGGRGDGQTVGGEFLGDRAIRSIGTKGPSSKEGRIGSAARAIGPAWRSGARSAKRSFVLL